MPDKERLRHWSAASRTGQRSNEVRHLKDKIVPLCRVRMEILTLARALSKGTIAWQASCSTRQAMEMAA